MSSAQKVIKVLAIIFAIFLIVNIFSAIFAGISIFAGIFYWGEEDYEVSNSVETMKPETIDSLIKSGNINLKIDLEIANLEIKQGNTFAVEKRNTSAKMDMKVSGNTLTIKEKNSGWFWNSKKAKGVVTITIPESIILNDVKIEAGIGRNNIEGIKASKLTIEAGVGVTYLNRIEAKETNINGGAGSLTIENSILEDLDLDCGVGLTKISADIQGNSKISCGVGKTEINLTQPKENYTIKTQTGLGAIMLNGEKCQDDGAYGNGMSNIKIDGGVGSVDIKAK